MKDLKSTSGWLSPTGDFFECLYTEHWDKAMELCKKYNLKIVFKGFFNKDPEMTLERKGWVKLSLGTVEYVLEPGSRMTQKQLDFIFDYLMANGKNMRRFEQIFTQCS